MHTLIKIFACLGCLAFNTSAVHAKDWLASKELQRLIQPPGHYRDKGANWCQFYDKNGTFTFKNLKTGETRVGKHWIDDKGRVCLKGPKMSSPQCLKAYYSSNRQTIWAVGEGDSYKMSIKSLEASLDACKF